MTRAEYELEQMARQKEETIRYKKMLIADILKMQTKTEFTEDQLKQKSIRTLERIFDNC